MQCFNIHLPYLPQATVTLSTLCCLDLRGRLEWAVLWLPVLQCLIISEVHSTFPTSLRVMQHRVRPNPLHDGFPPTGMASTPRSLQPTTCNAINLLNCGHGSSLGTRVFQGFHPLPLDCHLLVSVQWWFYQILEMILRSLWCPAPQ